jgi:hypothetical protein
LALLASFAGASLAAASPITDALEGEWSGSGTLALANGKTEHLRCRGDGRAVTENTIELEFECASTAKNLDFSTSMRFSSGRAEGTWDAPDRRGTLKGSASARSLSLALSSTEGDGKLTARMGGCGLSFNVTGWSDELKSLSADLKKSC